MRICIVGAGAIGGFLGARLALSGQDVTLIARGAHLAAIRRNGLKLVMADGATHVAPGIRATDSFTEAGEHDVVVLALKAHQIAEVAASIPALMKKRATIVTVQNGIPWWYFQKLEGPYRDRRLESLDPGGRIAAHIDADRIVGCIAYPACEIVEPGVIRHVEGNRFPVGELEWPESHRTAMLAEMLTEAGFKSFVLDDIRSEIWLKAWGNLTFNPVSALTHSTLEDICRFSPTRILAESMMLEAQEIAHKLGVSFRHTIEKRIAGAEAVGAHKTSMLQDVERGKALETEALIGAVVELGRMTATPTPHIDAVYACTSLLARSLGSANRGLSLVDGWGAAAATVDSVPMVDAAE